MADAVKPIYEAMFLVDPTVASADWDGLVDTVKTIFDRAGAEVVNLRKWDERRLTYPVAGRKRGIYILAYFHVDPDKITGLERDVKLNESILRALILRGDHVTAEQIDAPTPAMRQASGEGDSEFEWRPDRVEAAPAAGAKAVSVDAPEPKLEQTEIGQVDPE